MTGEQFMVLLNMSFTEYCGNESEVLKLSYNRDLSMRELKIVLLAHFMEILEYYFRDTISGDDNFFTEEEIQDVITHVNKIMGTEYYFDFS